MPILHSQFSGRGKSPEGQEVQLPPLVALLQRGPVLQVAITIAEQIATAAKPLVPNDEIRSLSRLDALRRSKARERE